MIQHSRKLLISLAIVVSVLMVLGGLVALLPSSTQTGNSASTVTTSVGALNALSNPAPLSSKATGILSDLASKGIPAKYVYLPNFNAHVNKVGNLIGPSYTTAPAPMGVGAYGLMLNSSGYQGFNLTTPSFEGILNMSSLQDLYPLDDGPTSVTVQLNAVLDNVALFGNSSYSFWTQNVLFYSARTHSLTFIDNIWNFSSPAFNMTANSMYSHDGTIVSPVYYYTIGPTFTVSYPFEVRLFLNTTVISGRSTVFFNYSLTSSGQTTSGSYDEVQFNSTPASNPSYQAPQPTYLVSGTQLTPTGFIPYDAEIMLGGPGGGSTANVYQINATMQLQYMNGSMYQNVPSAFDVGSETGETSQGVAVSWTSNDVAHLQAGPSFVYPMWGASPSDQMTTYSGQVSPSNAFLFVSPGDTFNNTTATWSPLSLTGSYSFTLPSYDYYAVLGYTPNSNFTATAMLSEYDPSMFSLSSMTTTNLQSDPSMGIYTPLYAFDNSQLSSIAMHYRDAYFLENSGSAQINPLFGELNDYAFPSFVGILLANVNVPVFVYNMPQMNIQYTGFNSIITSFYGLPSSNEMGIVIYDSSNVAVKGNVLSGWFSSTLTEFPVANLLLWNSNNVVVSDNLFLTMDSSMLIYNTHREMGHNIVYGNFFLQSSELNSTNYAPIAVTTTLGTLAAAPTGLTVYSNDNYIFGNAFAVYLTAISPGYSIYSGLTVHYHDHWSVGHSGNYWWNYYGFAFAKNGKSHVVKPYNNYGLITSGYDEHPMPLPGFYNLVTDFENS